MFNAVSEFQQYLSGHKILIGGGLRERAYLQFCSMVR